MQDRYYILLCKLEYCFHVDRSGVGEVEGEGGGVGGGGGGGGGGGVNGGEIGIEHA